MTCGIYLLGFNGTPKVYIGQSGDIQYRFKDHIKKLRDGNHSVKMLEAYKNYGFPELEILEEGDLSYEKLNELENYHIKLWNAVDDGFNSLYRAEDTPISRMQGDTNGSAKFTNDQIRQAFLLLVNRQELSYLSISKITGVPLGIVGFIASGFKHKWLKNEFNEEYTILENLKGTRNSISQTAKHRGIEYPLVVDPLGNVYNIENVKQFCIKHKLNNGNFHQVLIGNRKTVQGWKLAV